MITTIRVIECGASQLSRGGIRRRTWRSSSCDSDFASYGLPVARLEELSRSPGAEFTVARSRESESKRKARDTTIRRRRRVKRVGVRMSSFNRSHPFRRLDRPVDHYARRLHIRESSDFRNCNCVLIIYAAATNQIGTLFSFIYHLTILMMITFSLLRNEGRWL